MKLEEKVAIITGAAKGIGKEIALTLSEVGYKVVIADIDLNGAKNVVEEINSKNGNAIVK
jgi:3-hydroxybutyrate dehydrogenase